ncbi:hypothetical protein [Methylocella sp. CPCC 101449]|uniref:hypothetical protein n=1 Tax=Methylocella sp. CPCC 101449 TaxID=2987531 RepID=UPI00288F7B5D|nr:hypothetical protein [Methylocella sp. CPCC 101449]MDT2023125.1 hypothetical protein [Methylocella sp. CPCC 101449]
MLAFTGLMLAVWHLAVRFELVNRTFVADPADAIAVILRQIGSGALLESVLATITRMASGWLLASLLGILIARSSAVRAWRSKPSCRFWKPCGRYPRRPSSPSPFFLSASTTHVDRRHRFRLALASPAGDNSWFPVSSAAIARGRHHA